MCFRSRRIAIQFLLLNLFVAAAPFAAPSAEKTPEECLRDLEEGRTLLQEDLLTAAKNGFEALTQRDAKNATYEYQLGRVYLYLARVSESRRDNKLRGEGLKAESQPLRSRFNWMRALRMRTACSPTSTGKRSISAGCSRV